jgi:hypothetical protein
LGFIQQGVPHAAHPAVHALRPLRQDAHLQGQGSKEKARRHCRNESGRSAEVEAADADTGLLLYGLAKGAPPSETDRSRGELEKSVPSNAERCPLRFLGQSPARRTRSWTRRRSRWRRCRPMTTARG